MLSIRTKEAIKTALAMTIAYGIALSMDWDRPYWAGFAVAVISLSTIGQSLNKGAMRMLGTLVALVVSLAIIALFAQERWWFMVALSAMVGYCTYRMGGSRQPYFWFVAGFATVVICFDGGTNAANAFETAVLRAQETGLGILVYSVVATLLWPTNSRGNFQAASAELAAAQHALYTVGTQVINRSATLDQTHADSARLTAAHGAFNQALQAATIDTYEVWDLRRPWQRYQRGAGELMNTLERWRESLADSVRLDLHQLLPQLDQTTAELDRRLAGIERMLAGQPAEAQPQDIDRNFDRDRVHRLSHFDKAAFAVARRRLQHLDELTRELFACASDIGGFDDASPAPVPPAPAKSTWLPDPDHLTAAVRAMAGLWAAYLIWIYVEIPGGSSFATIAGPFGMIVATTPRMKVTALLAPVMLAIAFASFLYIFVMPQLSGFVELGTMIFLATFAICYRYATPAQAIGRAFGLAMFVTIAGISNDQSYNFLSPANTALMMPMVLIVLAFVAWFPHSSQPEKVYLRLLRRFFRSGEYLMNTLYRRDLGDNSSDAGSGSGAAASTNADAAHLARHVRPWRTAFHKRELSTLPAKLSAWGAVVGKGLLPNGSPEPLQGLNTRLHSLSLRLQELLEAGGDPQADLLVRELLTDVRAWRLKVQEAIGELSSNPTYTSAEQLDERLATRLQLLEERIRETLNKAADGELSDRDAQNFYRLLGAYRGVSEALVDFTADAGRIDWPLWRENRF